MNKVENLSVLIVTYNTTEKIILDCLNSIQNNVKVLIVENSKNFLHKDVVNSKFPNVEIHCTGKNLGYGGGNNYGLKKINDDYALILNPDVICDKDLFKNIPKVINEIKSFSIIGCQYLHDKIFMPAGFFNKHKNANFKDNFKNNKVESLSKVEWVTGCSMLINLKKFDDKEIFDKNFFLYFEEIDLCKSVIKKGENIFSSQKLRIHHLGFRSSIDENASNKINLNKLREWHWMWSSFYFYKKNYNYLYAVNQMIGKLIKSLVKLLFYSKKFQKNKKEKYLYRFLGLYNSFLNYPSHFREK